LCCSSATSDSVMSTFTVSRFCTTVRLSPTALALGVQQKHAGDRTPYFEGRTLSRYRARAAYSGAPIHRYKRDPM